MMLVHPEYRGHGIGSGLMRTALDHLFRTQVEAIKLDATPAGRRLYESLGFTSQLEVQRWERISEILSPAHEDFSRQSIDQLRLAIYALDRTAFGADRSPLLEHLLNRRFVEATIVKQSRPLSALGYGIARRGAAAYYIGPIIAREDSVAVRVLDSLLGRLHGRKVFIDLLAHDDNRAHLLIDRGFTMQRSLVRMSFGKPTPAATSAFIFSSAGAELG
jgi:hypothetical protein